MCSKYAERSSSEAALHLPSESCKVSCFVKLWQQLGAEWEGTKD